MLYKVLLMIITCYSITLMASDEFIYTKSSAVNMRIGPGRDYPVKWLYTKKNIPLMVIEKFDDWIKVKDIDGECGWVLKFVVYSGANYAFAKEEINAHKSRKADSRVTLKLQKMSLIKVDKCSDDMCVFNFGNRKGWVNKSDLWGIS